MTISSEFFIYVESLPPGLIFSLQIKYQPGREIIFSEMIFSEMIFSETIFSEVIFSEMIFSKMIFSEMIFSDTIFSADQIPAWQRDRTQ